MKLKLICIHGRIGIVGSAVCSFTLDSIQESFGGPFKGQSSATSMWESYHSSHSHSHCHGSSSAHHQSSLLEAEKFQLMDRAVQSTQKTPLVRHDLQRLSHIAVDVAATKLHYSVHVLYVATLDGIIHKYTVLPRTQETCLVEIIDPFQHGASFVHRHIKTMHFLKQMVRTYARHIILFNLITVNTTVLLLH